MASALALLRRVTDNPLLLPLVALLLRGRTVTRSGAFVARELAGHGRAFSYCIRATPQVQVVVRHGSGDSVTLGEVFHEHDYEPPGELRIGEAPRIVDLGANAGYFGAFALARWPGSRVQGFEPDPDNAAVHRRVISLNGAQDRWRLEQAAAAGRDGELRFEASGDAQSHVSATGAVTVRALDVLPVVAGADLLKMDIEGGEWEILDDPRFAEDPPAAVIVEYHPARAAGPDPRAAALDRLAAGGLTATSVGPERCPGYGMVWAWRP